MIQPIQTLHALANFSCLTTANREETVPSLTTDGLMKDLQWPFIDPLKLKNLERLDHYALMRLTNLGLSQNLSNTIIGYSELGNNQNAYHTQPSAS